MLILNLASGMNTGDKNPDPPEGEPQLSNTLSQIQNLIQDQQFVSISQLASLTNVQVRIIVYIFEVFPFRVTYNHLLNL